MAKGKQRAQKRKKFSVSNEYAGYVISEDGEQVEMVDPAMLSWEEFMTRFVLPRKPCLFSSISLGSQEGKELMEGWKDVEELKKKAGDVVVQVEHKVNGMFGSGEKRVEMSFGSFIDKLQQGERELYMTTQYKKVEKEEDATEVLEREYCQAPLTALRDDFPMVPWMLKGLMPQQVNLWMGSCPVTCYSDGLVGTSSGLHHDFADNLYVLLKGNKRFTLFDPSQTENMSTVGKVQKVYDNGYIVYGSGNENVKFMPRSDGADPLDVAKWRIQAAERKVEQDPTNEEAEEELERAMDALLDFDEDDDKEETNDSSVEPPSFSQISVEALHVPGKQDAFPCLSRTKRCIALMEQGQMLYLPTGWFHEVSSWSTNADGIHMAMNYWFHAPSSNPLHPLQQLYVDDYWRDKVACLFQKHQK